MSTHTPESKKPIQIGTILTDPSFPEWGKRLIREVADKDVVDVCNVLEFLTKIWTVKCHEAIGLPVEPELNPAAFRACVEALRDSLDLIQRLPAPGNWGIIADDSIIKSKQALALAEAQR